MSFPWVPFPPQDGTPVLHVAIEKGMESVALKLIAAGCDVSVVDKVGVAAMILFCRFRHPPPYPCALLSFVF